MNILHIILSILAAFSVALILFCRLETMNVFERFGLGLIGSGTLMTIGPVVSEHSPFDLWAGGLLRVGVILLVWGLAHRHQRVR